MCFLIQFSYAHDPRVRKAIDWILALQLDDGMWYCRGEKGRGCLRVMIDILSMAALDPETSAQPGIARAAAAVCDLLMAPRMSRYHIGEAWGTGASLKYPYLGFSIISALESLARLCYTPDEPKIAAAVAYMLSRQLPNGSWPLDESWSNPPIDFGRQGESNKWLMLDAMGVVMLLSCQH